jgi:hypothetical protein
VWVFFSLLCLLLGLICLISCFALVLAILLTRALVVLFVCCSILLLCCSSCSMLFLLFDVVALLVQRCYFMAPLAQHYYCSLLWHWYSLFTQILFCYTLDLVVPCSLFDIAALVSNWYSPSSCFASVGGAVQIEFLHAKLARWGFFFKIFVCWLIFLTIHIFEKCWLTMCLFIVRKNYLDIVHWVVHIAFNLHNYIVYFLHMVHFF